MAVTKPKFRDDLAILEIDGEAVVFDERTGGVHHLNPTAAIMTRLLDGSATVRESVEDIVAALDAPSRQVDREVRALVKRFRDVGLLEGPSGRPAAGRGRGNAPAGAHQHDHQHREDRRQRARDQKEPNP